MVANFTIVSRFPFRSYSSLRITDNIEENRKYWDNVVHQRYFLDKIYQKLNFKSMEDWYNLPPIELIKLGGGEVLSRYASSLPQMLQSLYPEMHFNSVYYGKTFFHNSFWTSNENLRYYMDYLAVHVLNFNSIEDWFKITPSEIGNVIGGKTFLQRTDGNVLKALQIAYPEIKVEILEKAYEERQKELQLQQDQKQKQQQDQEEEKPEQN